MRSRKCHDRHDLGGCTSNIRHEITKTDRKIRAADLVSSCVFKIECFAGPKAAVCLALSSTTILSRSPVDSRGLTSHYIEALPCPGPIAAGCIGLSSDDLVTACGPDGVFRSGFITRIVDDHGPSRGSFEFRSEDGDPEHVQWHLVREVNGEALPVRMPFLDPQSVFLMVRRDTPEHIVERMLYFSVRARKRYLILEILQRLSPSPEVLGRVLMMVLFHETIIESLGDDLQSGHMDCLRILLVSGAVIPRVAAVHADVYVAPFYSAPPGSGRRESIILARECLWYQKFSGANRAQCFRRFDAMPAHHFRTFGRVVRPGSENWFPLQFTAGDYFGRDGWILHQPDGWHYRIAGGVEQPFSSHAESAMPPKSEWFCTPDGEVGRGSTLVVNDVDAAALVGTFEHDKQRLLSIAEDARQEWLWRGWNFRGPSRQEQLQEVLPSLYDAIVTGILYDDLGYGFGPADT